VCARTYRAGWPTDVGRGRDRVEAETDDGPSAARGTAINQSRAQTGIVNVLASIATPIAHPRRRVVAEAGRRRRRAGRD